MSDQPDNAAPAVQTHNITHSYGDARVLTDVTLSIPPHQIFGLLGPNGSGKTTLFRILTTLLRPSRGTAHVFGSSTTRHPERVRQQIGMIFQQPALDDKLTVRENLELHGALYGLSGRSLHRRVDEILELFDLMDRGDHQVEDLSGGLKRRTDLGRGLLHRPRLLVLDEPTHELDPRARRNVWQQLAYLVEEVEMTVLVATHLMEIADRCDHIAIIDEGRVAVQGAPHSLKKALGPETLWLETTRPELLQKELKTRFGLAVNSYEDAVQILNEDAHLLLGKVYESLESLITSATVRQPSLEDVFMTHTGKHLDLSTAPQEEVVHPA